MEIVGGKVKWEYCDWKNNGTSLYQTVEVNGISWTVSIEIEKSISSGTTLRHIEKYVAKTKEENIRVDIRMEKLDSGFVDTVRVQWDNPNGEEAEFNYCFNSAFGEANVVAHKTTPDDKLDLLNKILNVQDLLSAFEFKETLEYALKHLRHELNLKKSGPTYVLFKDAKMRNQNNDSPVSHGDFLLVGPRRTWLNRVGDEDGFAYAGFQLFDHRGRKITSKDRSLSLNEKDGYYEIFILNPDNWGQSTFINVTSFDDKKPSPEIVETPGNLSQFVLSLVSQPK